MLSSVAARAGGRVLLSCSAQARRRSVRALSATSSGSGGPRGGSVSMSYRSVEYEVHGIVQGVFFRAHTVDRAKSLGLVGYVMNTAQGTVRGEVQGRPEAVEQMKDWLSTTGSPHSVIERCDFSNERQLEGLDYTQFSTRRR